MVLLGCCWANIKMHTGKQADNVSAKHHHMLRGSFVSCHVLACRFSNKANGLSRKYGSV